MVTTSPFRYLRKTALSFLLLIPFGLCSQVKHANLYDEHGHLNSVVYSQYKTVAQKFLGKQNFQTLVLADIPFQKRSEFLRFIGSVSKYHEKCYVVEVAEGKITNELQAISFIEEVKNVYQGYYRNFLKGGDQGRSEEAGEGNREPVRAAGQPCQNMDFETQTFFAWEGSFGVNCDPLAVPGMDSLAINSATGQHTIMTGGVDPIIPSIPCVMPGGTASVRLGDNGGGGNWAARISQTFQVQAANPYFVYNYAVVLEDVGHPIIEQPFFQIRMFDSNGNVISCASLDVDATNAPGLIDVGGVKYRNWTQVVIPLTTFVGQDVTIQFTTGDCNNTPPVGGAHDGYAYIDCSCIAPQFFTSGPAICAGIPITITAPSGLASYTWSGPGIVGANTGQTISANVPGLYTVSLVTLTTPPNAPCTFTLDTMIGGNPSNPIAGFTSNFVCEGTPTQFTDQSTPAGAITWAWDFTNNGTIDDTTQNPTFIYPNDGFYIASLTVTENSCTDNFTDTVFVGPGIPPIINPAGPYCQTAAAVTLTANTTNGIWAGPGITNPNTGAFNPGVAGLGSHLITLTSLDSCGGIDSIYIAVNPVPVANAGPDVTICSGIAAAIGAPNTPGFVYSWSPAAGLNSTTISNPSVTLINPGPGTITNNYVVTTTSPGCAGSVNDAVNVTVNPAATTNAGAPQTICEGSTVTLNGSFGGAATSASWVGGTGTYNPNSSTMNAIYNPSNAEIGAGQVVLTLQSNDPPGPCPSATSTVTITINPLAVISAGADFTACTIPIPLAGSLSGGATLGTWSGGGGTFSSVNDPLATYTPTAAEEAAGTITLFFQSNDPAGPCGPDADTVTIGIVPGPSVNAGPDQIFCNGSSANLSGSFGGTASSASWTGGSGTYSPNAASMNMTYTPTAAEVASGSVTLTLVTNDPPGTCGPASDAVQIVYSPPPVVNAGPDQQACSNIAASLAGVLSGGATSATWSGGAGVFSPSNTDPLATYTATAAEVAAGSLTLYLQSNDPVGPCVPHTDSMVLTFFAPAIANAGPDQTICGGSTVSLSGSIGGTASSGTWTGGAGVFSPNANTLNATYTPTGAEIAGGSVSLTLVSNDPSGPCGSASDVITILINPPAVVNAGADITICRGSTANLWAAVGGGAGSITWSGGAGTFSPNVNSLNAVYTPTLAEESAGTVILTCTTNDPAGPCGSASDNLVITIQQLAVVDAGPPQTICAGFQATLEGTIGGSASLATWSGGSGTFFPNANTLNAGYLPSAAEASAGSVTLTLTTNDPAGPCAAVSDVVTLTINPAAVVNAGPDQTICIGSNVNLNATLSGTASNGTWTGGGGIYSPGPTSLNPIYTPTAAEQTAGSVVLTFVSNDPAGPCPAGTDAMIITINQLPTVDAGPSQQVCAGFPVSLNGTIGGSATFATWSGGSGTYNPNSGVLNATYTPTPAEISAGSLVLTLTTNDPAGPCTFTSDNMTITFSPAPSANAGPDQTICAGSSVNISGMFGGTASSGSWSGGLGVFTPGAASPNATYTPTFAEISAGSVSLIFSTDDPVGPCPPATDVVVITINPQAIVSAGNSQNICAGSVINLNGTYGGGATSGSWSGGAGTYMPDVNSPTAIYTPAPAEIAAGSVTLTFTSNDPAGPCPAVSANVTHFINQLPVVAFSIDAPNGCPVHCVNFTDLSNIPAPESISAWNWNFGDMSPNDTLQNPSHCYNNTGIYTVTLTATSNNGCSTTLTGAQQITVYPVPTAAFSASPSGGSVLEPVVTLHDESSSDAISWFWDFGDGQSTGLYNQDPTHAFPNSTSGTYTVTLTVTNSFGCTDSEQETVYIAPEFAFYIPNSFTPNGDGTNDYFFGSGIGIEEYHIAIYDRWGNMVWSGNELSDKWNGKVNYGSEVAQQDVYVWKVELKDVFLKLHQYMGIVTLVK